MKSKINYLFSLVIFIIFYGQSKAQWMEWECKSNNTISEFSGYIDTMKERGYVPSNFNIMTFSNSPKVSSIWKKNTADDWAFWYGMNRQEFIKKIKDFNSRGLSPIDIAVYYENVGELRFAAIWHKINYEGIIEVDIDANELRKKLRDYNDQGYSPRDINGYKMNNEVFYTCIFDKQPRGQLIISYGVDIEDLEEELTKNKSKGYFPLDLNYFNYRGNVYYNCIWAVADVAWEFGNGFKADSFQEYLDIKTNAGYIPIDIDQYYQNGEFYYSATFKKNKNYDTVKTPQPRKLNEIQYDEESYKLDIFPVEQQTKVWCWLATGEMILKHFGLPNRNPYGNYQCGIIGSIFYNSVCNQNCFNTSCIRGSGSNLNTVRMLKDYSWLSARKVFNCKEAYELTFSDIKRNIDQEKPILCGISPSRRRYYDGAEHVVVLVGYDVINSVPKVIINDPFPYPNYDNPYLKLGATVLQSNQYLIDLDSFTINMFWHWSLSDIDIT